MGKLEKELKRLRLANNLTQIDVANHLKYSSQQMISNWERGQALAPDNALGKLAILFKANIDDLIDLRINDYRSLLKRL
jgi:transcriptional regulator with XRE-family HTH domain